jgi:hypothetical protein
MTRRNVLIVAGAVAVLMFLFPPWNYVRSLGADPKVKYAPLFQPPLGPLEGWGRSPAHIAGKTLGTQYLALAVIAGAILLLISKRPQ